MHCKVPHLTAGVLRRRGPSRQAELDQSVNAKRSPPRTPPGAAPRAALSPSPRSPLRSTCRRPARACHDHSHQRSGEGPFLAVAASAGRHAHPDAHADNSAYHDPHPDAHADSGRGGYSVTATAQHPGNMCAP